MDATPVLPLDEAALREAHATLTRILGAIEEYVYTGEFLPNDGYRVVFAGPCREQFLGTTVEQARTAVWRYYVHPDDWRSSTPRTTARRCPGAWTSSTG
jgi:hypothetical protein